MVSPAPFLQATNSLLALHLVSQWRGDLSEDLSSPVDCWLGLGFGSGLCVIGAIRATASAEGDVKNRSMARFPQSQAKP